MRAIRTPQREADNSYCYPSEGGCSLAQVIVKPGEPLDTALKRFKKQLQQDGTLKQARAHEFYEKPSDKRRKEEAARRRKIKQNEER